MRLIDADALRKNAQHAKDISKWDGELLVVGLGHILNAPTIEPLQRETEPDERTIVLPCKVGDTVFIDTEGFMGMPLPHMPMVVQEISAKLYGDLGDCKQEQYVSLEELRALAEPKGEATT